MIWTSTISLWIVHQSDILPRFIIDGYCGTVCAHDSGYSSGNDNHLRTNHVPQFMHSAHQLRNIFFTMNTCLFHHHHSGKQASKQTSKQASKQTKQNNTKQNKQTKTHRQTQTNERTNERTNEQPDRHRQTDKQTNRRTCIAPTWNHAILEFPILTTIYSDLRVRSL